MKSPSKRTRPLLTVLLLTLAASATSGCWGHHAFFAIGTAVDILPHGFVSVTVGTTPYYYHRGTFYQRHRHGYVVVPAPIGAVIMLPPPGYVTVMVERDPFAYYGGVFYRPYGSEWIVVGAPPGAFVRRLPAGARPRYVGAVEYKEYAGAWYRPAVRGGDRGWEVAERPVTR